MTNQSIGVLSLSRDLRRLAARSQGSSKVRGPSKTGRRGGGGCCILLIIIAVAIIAYAYIDAYILRPSKKNSGLGMHITSVTANAPEYYRVASRHATAKERWLSAALTAQFHDALDIFYDSSERTAEKAIKYF